MKSTNRRLALPVVALLVVWAWPALAGQTMTEAEITATFTGMTLDGTYLDGTYFTETYHDDGTIRYWDAVGADSGEWEVKDGQFCTFYDSQQGACFSVERDGANCFTFYERDDQDRRDRPRRDGRRAAGTGPTTPPAPPRPEVGL